jgi:hypothetical protein
MKLNVKRIKGGLKKISINKYLRDKIGGDAAAAAEVKLNGENSGIRASNLDAQQMMMMMRDLDSEDSFTGRHFPPPIYSSSILITTTRTSAAKTAVGAVTSERKFSTVLNVEDDDDYLKRKMTRQDAALHSIKGATRMKRTNAGPLVNAHINMLKLDLGGKPKQKATFKAIGLSLTNLFKVSVSSSLSFWHSFIDIFYI